MASRELIPRRRASDSDPSLVEQRLQTLETIANMLSDISAEQTVTLQKIERSLATLGADLSKNLSDVVEKVLSDESNTTIDRFISRAAGAAQKAARRNVLDAIWAQMMLGWKVVKGGVIAVVVVLAVAWPIGALPSIAKAWNWLAPEKWRLP